jgi:hypothetical protein
LYSIPFNNSCSSSLGYWSAIQKVTAYTCTLPLVVSKFQIFCWNLWSIFVEFRVRDKI